jgi:hypothetical protein
MIRAVSGRVGLCRKGVGMLAGKQLLADIGPLRESAAFRRLWAGSRSTT